MQNKRVNPPKAVPAATVILIREYQAELQVYLLKRHAKSGFMAGNYVFAGGILDPDVVGFVQVEPLDYTRVDETPLW